MTLKVSPRRYAGRRRAKGSPRILWRRSISIYIRRYPCGRHETIDRRDKFARWPVRAQVRVGLALEEAPFLDPVPVAVVAAAVVRPFLRAEPPRLRDEV